MIFTYTHILTVNLLIEHFDSTIDIPSNKLTRMQKKRLCIRRTNTEGKRKISFLKREKTTQQRPHIHKRHTVSNKHTKAFFLFTSFFQMRYERSSRSLVLLVKINKQHIKSGGGAKIRKIKSTHRIFAHEFEIRLNHSRQCVEKSV